MRNVLLSSLIVIIGFCGLARAEVYEIPLPVTGMYEARDRRLFTVDFGTEFSEVRAAQLYLEGTMVAPLVGHTGLNMSLR